MADNLENSTYLCFNQLVRVSLVYVFELAEILFQDVQLCSCCIQPSKQKRSLEARIRIKRCSAQRKTAHILLQRILIIFQFPILVVEVRSGLYCPFNVELSFLLFDV